MIFQKPKAQKYMSKGVEFLEGNMLNADHLRNVLNGAYGVFAVTNFYDPESMGREELIGKQIADIAYESGVKHFVWSSLPNAQKNIRRKIPIAKIH